MLSNVVTGPETPDISTLITVMSKQYSVPPGAYLGIPTTLHVGCLIFDSPQ